MVKYVLGVVLSFFLVVPGHAQMKSAAVNAAETQKIVAERETVNNNLSIDAHQRLEQEQVKRLFADRQAQLRLDTEKLLALVAELKLNVDKSNPNILSMDVIKKAQEIQKLAKSVQDKMKTAY